MRPAGEVRQALLHAAQQLVHARPEVAQHGLTWRELAAQARVGHAVARATVSNMLRDGVLEPVAIARVPGCNRGMRTVRPAGRSPSLFDRDGGLAPLAAVTSSWVRGRG